MQHNTLLIHPLHANCTMLMLNTGQQSPARYAQAQPALKNSKCCPPPPSAGSKQPRWQVQKSGAYHMQQAM
eukprot:3628641-Amphidinium_carterae.1